MRAEDRYPLLYLRKCTRLAFLSDGKVKEPTTLHKPRYAALHVGECMRLIVHANELCNRECSKIRVI